MATLAALLTLGAMMQTAHSRLAADIEKVRDDLGADIKALDNRLRAVEIDVAAIRTATMGLAHRRRAVESPARHGDTSSAAESG
ncbi:MAG: hypothetical protein J4F38_10950 [Pseudomonadales bacterium]|nr:hypothetical protein [Pseudomonadales bacterium]